MSKTALVTGALGLVGSEVTRRLTSIGWKVVGLDNNMRAEWFGKDGNVGPMMYKLLEECHGYSPLGLDVRNRGQIMGLFKDKKFSAVVHCAAQPSHDLSAQIPDVDWDVNAGGTMNLLLAAREHAPKAPFIFMSTNKVYGDGPNVPLITETPTRFKYTYENSTISEACSLENRLRTPLGASKLAADVMVQEFGRYYGMPTTCLRAGCITGGAHAGAMLHGFLSYLVRCAVEGREYTIYGHKGKQVRDNVHASDVADAVKRLIEKPTYGEVFNIGGGEANSISILEAIVRLDKELGQRMKYKILEKPRKGDHIVYVTDFAKLTKWCGWKPTKNLDDIFTDLLEVARAARP